MRTTGPTLVAWIFVSVVFVGLPIGVCGWIAATYPEIATGIGMMVVMGAFRTARLIRTDAVDAQDNAMAARARTNRQAALALAARNQKTRTQAEALINKHAATLAAQRRRLTVASNTGRVDDSQWLAAVEVFIDEQIEKSGCRVRTSPALLRAVREAIARASAGRAPSAPSSAPGSTPVAYEHAVAEGLKALGWRTRLTAPGEDRYFDVIAQMRDKRVIVQCPGFVSPIRASVIQALDDARTRAGANHAAIVTNARLTQRARDLATLTGVIILRHDTLRQLQADVFGNVRPSSAKTGTDDSTAPDGGAAPARVQVA